MSKYARAISATLALGLVLGVAHPVAAADKVQVGIISNGSDAPFFIADSKGYFHQEGIDVTLTTFDSAGKMIAPLGTGELDVGSGATSAGLYNAAGRGIAIRIVADRARMATGYNYQTLMIRKELVDSGKFKTLKDLKGLKIALAAPSISTGSALNEAAKKGGISYNDVEKVYLSFPQQVTAFATGAADGSIMIEPFATRAVEAGSAVRFSSTEDFYPGDQISVVFYGAKFATERADVAKRFMKAYVRAARDYLDSVDGGRFATTVKGDEIVQIMAKYLNLKPEQIRATYVQAIDPNGEPNVASLKNDLKFFKDTGDVTASDISVDKILDLSFVQAAVKELGPYAPAK